MNIVLFGPPGAGKGTQANNIVKRFNFFKVSTGDLLREEIKNNTNLGTKVKSTVNAGLLVSDDIINDLITKILRDKKFCNRLIFDGYPRNLNQAENLNFFMEIENESVAKIQSMVSDCLESSTGSTKDC